MKSSTSSVIRRTYERSASEVRPNLTNYTHHHQPVVALLLGVGGGGKATAYLFLLHEFGIGTIIHHMATKHRRCKWRVNFFGADILEFAVQNKLVSLGTQTHSRLLAEENKGKYIAVLQSNQSEQGQGKMLPTLRSSSYLRAAFKEEFVWIHAITYRATDERKPMENHRGFP